MIAKILGVALLIALAALAGCRRQQIRYVDAPLIEGERSTASLWDSEASWSLCVKEMIERVKKNDGRRALPESCEKGQAGELNHGTKLELLAPADPCGKTIAKVRVLSGKLEGRTGCMSPKSVAFGINP